MTINMTFSLPDEVAAYLKAGPNASATVAAAIRRQMLEDALAGLPRREQADPFLRASGDAFMSAETQR
ncbi:hypothetical protein OG946_23490 [Streptomyces sp. NBC_01808]|uniref:hypothetical protein n=1 Tax=Streptomyces sp. NBC_01808 TaxID=2975947 RepID=UPI002DDC7A19|nr:hypothetical protein [Streptomyces sp. NBC_01808]WSA40068.1 hypothetical protein OG946_23490 [Streptomyces sp. NBC_01808]